MIKVWCHFFSCLLPSVFCDSKAVILIPVCFGPSRSCFASSLGWLDGEINALLVVVIHDRRPL